MTAINVHYKSHPYATMLVTELTALRSPEHLPAFITYLLRGATFFGTVPFGQSSLGWVQLSGPPNTDG